MIFLLCDPGWHVHKQPNAHNKRDDNTHTHMQTVLLCKRPPTSYNNLYRGRNCYTTHTAKATYRYFLGTRLRLPRRVTLERVPTGWYFLFSACGVDMLPPRPSPLSVISRVGNFCVLRFYICIYRYGYSLSAYSTLRRILAAVSHTIKFHLLYSLIVSSHTNKSTKYNLKFHSQHSSTNW